MSKIFSFAPPGPTGNSLQYCVGRSSANQGTSALVPPSVQRARRGASQPSETRWTCCVIFRHRFGKHYTNLTKLMDPKKGQKPTFCIAGKPRIGFCSSWTGRSQGQLRATFSVAVEIVTPQLRIIQLRFKIDVKWNYKMLRHFIRCHDMRAIWCLGVIVRATKTKGTEWQLRVWPPRLVPQRCWTEPGSLGEPLTC